MSDELVKAHLLVVDDDDLLRGIAVKSLRHAGFEVTEASSGEDALAKFAAHAYDLLVLDLVMRGIDGYAVCRQLRATTHGAHIPILILTGLNDTDSIELAYRSGATDFITKPINWTLFSHRVRYALRASRSDEEIRRSRESLARAQRLARMGSWAIFPDGRMEFSAQLLRMLGTTGGARPPSCASAFLAHVQAADRERVNEARTQLAEYGTPYELEFQLVCFDGTVRTVFEQGAQLLDDQGRAIGVEGITQDITERVRAQKRIRQLAYYDSVTGLPNRQFLEVLAVAPLHRAARTRTSCAVLHVDIDRFKGVNDAFGRTQGDAVLKAVASRLRAWIRGSDFVSTGHGARDHVLLARVGSNAFTILIADLAGQDQAAIVAQRLLAALAQPMQVNSQSLVLTASMGIAFYPNDAHDLPGLARCAEQALHAARSEGRAQYRFFDAQMNAQATSRLLLEADLRHAIAKDELRLHFQPKVDAGSRMIVGAEALLRWQHPTRGLLAPGEFIRLAEQTGLIIPLTDWVLEAACSSLRSWADAGLPAVSLAVNLSAASFTHTGLIEQLDARLARFGLEPAALMLEMTESMLMDNVEAGVAQLARLRERGYGLSLDDFGTGYSSLSYLKRFPIDELKIDRSFVTDATSGGRSGALAAAIIALGRELGLQVVAEGVETQRQSDFLLEHGCSLQQGYLFARPMPRHEFEALLRAGTMARALVT